MSVLTRLLTQASVTILEVSSLLLSCSLFLSLSFSFSLWDARVTPFPFIIACECPRESRPVSLHRRDAGNIFLPHFGGKSYDFLQERRCWRNHRHQRREWRIYHIRRICAAKWRISPWYSTHTQYLSCLSFPSLSCSEFNAKPKGYLKFLKISKQSYDAAVDATRSPLHCRFVVLKNTEFCWTL